MRGSCPLVTRARHSQASAETAWVGPTQLATDQPATMLSDPFRESAGPPLLVLRSWPLRAPCKASCCAAVNSHLPGAEPDGAGPAPRLASLVVAPGDPADPYAEYPVMLAITVAVSPRAKSQRNRQRLRSTDPWCSGSVPRVRQCSGVVRGGCVGLCIAFYNAMARLGIAYF
jgi:hypothetical protein